MFRRYPRYSYSRRRHYWPYYDNYHCYGYGRYCHYYDHMYDYPYDYPYYRY